VIHWLSTDKYAAWLPLWHDEIALHSSRTVSAAQSNSSAAPPAPSSVPLSASTPSTSASKPLLLSAQLTARVNSFLSALPLRLLSISLGYPTKAQLKGKGSAELESFRSTMRSICDARAAQPETADHRTQVMQQRQCLSKLVQHGYSIFDDGAETSERAACERIKDLAREAHAVLHELNEELLNTLL
jgi:hypothetical protein